MFLPIISDNIFSAKNKILNEKLRKITYFSVKKSFEKNPYIFNFLKSSEKEKKDLIRFLISSNDDYVCLFFDGVLLNTTSSFFIKNILPYILFKKSNTALYGKIIYDPFNCLKKIPNEKSIKYPIYPWIWPQELIIKKNLFIDFIKYNINKENLLFTDRKINFNFFCKNIDFSYKVKKISKKDTNDEILYNQYIFSHLIHFVIEKNFFCERTDENFLKYLTYCYKSAAPEEQILDFLQDPKENKFIKNKNNGYYEFQYMYDEIINSHVCYPYNTSYFYRDKKIEKKEINFLKKYSNAFLYVPVSGFFSEILFKYYSQFINVEKIICFDFFEESLNIKKEIYKNLISIKSLFEYEELYELLFYSFKKNNQYLKKISKEKYHHYKRNIFKNDIIKNEKEIFQIMRNIEKKISFLRIDVVEENNKFLKILSEKNSNVCNILYFSDIFTYLPLTIKNNNLKEIILLYQNMPDCIFVGSKIT